MGLVRITPPALWPIDLDDAKRQLRIAHNQADTAIEAKIKSATLRIENWLERTLLEQTWRLTLDDFPEAGCPIILPRPRLMEVESIEYVDADDADQTLDAGDYDFNLDEEPAAIYPTDGDATAGEVWPVTNERPGNVVITYTAGYGQDRADVPDDIREAIRQLTTILYERPESGGEMPPDLQAMLMPYRVGLAEYA